MKLMRWGALGFAALAWAAAARAQTATILGQVVDGTGAPVAGAELEVKNTETASLTYKGTTDKKGKYTVNGVLVSEQHPIWAITLRASGYIPVKASVLARTSDKVRYFDDEPTLSAKNPTVQIKVRAFAEVHVDFTVRTGEPEEAAAPVPAAAAPIPEGVPAAPAIPGAPAAAADPGAESYAAAIESVRKGDPEGSIDLFKKAIEAKPDDWERRDLYAKVLSRLDRQGEATIQANKAAALAPTRAAPLVTLTEIYLARSLPDKASEAIGKARELEPDNLKVLERAASVAVATGKLDEALELNAKVLEKKPDNTEVLVAMADLYNRKKQPAKAEEMLKKVVDLDPKNAYRTFYNLGVIILNREDTTDADNRKAAESFRKSIELKPDYALAHRDLGFTYLRLGDLASARKELQKYVDIDPQARDAAEIKDTIKSLAPGR